jgi:hypothetical protein
LRLDDEALRVLPHSGMVKNREQYGAKVRMEKLNEKMASLAAKETFGRARDFFGK